MPTFTFRTSAWRGMLRTDGLRLIRDRFLIGMTLYIVGISVAMRWAIPWMQGELMTRLDFDLVPYYPLLVSHVVVQLVPLMVGMVGGFLLLESREDRTIKALLVSPVPLSTYVVISCIVLFVASSLLTCIEGAIIGWGLPPWPALAGISVAGAPAALAIALFIAALADNKVEAFAYLKFCGLAPLVPTGSYFLPEPWQWLAALYPPYWASKAYWESAAGSNTWPLWVLGGLVTSALWVGVMVQVFLQAARK